MVAEANRHIDREEPWALRRRGEQQRLHAVLYAAAEAVRVIGVALSPFLPDAAAEIARRVGSPEADQTCSALRWGGLVPGTAVSDGAPLFPRR